MFFPECVIIDESSSDRPVECTVVLGVQQTSIRERTGKLFSGIRLDSTVFITSYRGDIVGIFGRPRFHIHRSEGHGHITLELEMVEEIPPYTQIRLESLCCSLGSSIFYFVKYIIVIIILASVGMARVSIFLVIEITAIIVIRRNGTGSVHCVCVRIRSESEIIDFAVTAVQRQVD